MKKFSSLLVAIVVLLTMISTVAFAADAELYLSDVTYGGSGNITVSVICNTSYDAEVAEVYGYLMYDEDLFTLVSVPDGCYDEGGSIEVWFEPVTTAVVADEAIVTFEFAPKGDIIGYQFVMEEASLLANNERPFCENITTTVKAAAQDVKVPNTEAQISAAGAEVKIGDLFYEGVVVFDNEIVLEAGRSAKTVGWTLTAEGKETKDFGYDLPEIDSDGGSVRFAGIVFNVPEGKTITAVPYVVYGN